MKKGVLYFLLMDWKYKKSLKIKMERRRQVL